MVPGNANETYVGEEVRYQYETEISFVATAYQRYWFSVQADDHPLPQWMRVAAVEVTGCMSMFRSEYFSYPDWVEMDDVLHGEAMDLSQEMICQAYLTLEHTVLDPTDAVSEPIPIEADIAGYSHALNPDEIWVEYKTVTSQRWGIEEMTYQGAGNWMALIPGQSQPNAVGYYIHAEDILGHYLEFPPGGRENAWWFDVAWEFDPFEEESGWIVNPEGDDTADEGIWERAEPESTVAQPPCDHTIQGTHCWITGAAMGEDSYANDVERGKTTLQSPVYDLTGAEHAIVKYWRSFCNHHGWTIEGEWEAQVRNNGSDWIDMEPEPESVLGWTLVEADLNELIWGPLGEVEFRFVVTDVWYNESLTEGAIDDFEILVDGPNPASVAVRESDAERIVLVGGHPNPFRTETLVQFSLPAGMQIDLSIYNAQGQRLRTLVDGQPRSAGLNTTLWDGTDDSGRRVRSGVYFIQLDAEGKTATRSVTMFR